MCECVCAWGCACVCVCTFASICGCPLSNSVSDLMSECDYLCGGLSVTYDKISPIW